MEILVVTPEGLRPVKQFTINGRVQVTPFKLGDILNYLQLYGIIYMLY